MKQTVRMMWVEEKNEWHMLLENGVHFLQEFFDCENVHKFFPDLDKRKTALYQVEITKLN
jgi:hypothetical protein